MTKQTMTIHKGLAELKILNNRTFNTITSSTFCVANRHSNEKINGENIAVWHDYDKAYSDGLCGFTFINLNNVRITNLNLYC